MPLKENTDPLDPLSGFVDRLSQSEKKVEVSPSAMSHTHYEVPGETREKILLKANKRER